MQTFYPLDTMNFSAIAKTLDNKRLNKQALEGWQIMLTLLELDPQGNHRPAKGWKNHPAVKMWRGHEYALNAYVQAMVSEWLARGFKSTIGEKAEQTIVIAVQRKLVDPSSNFFPDFILDTQLRAEVASSHRRALLCKDYAWYSQFNWLEDFGVAHETYEYVWPHERAHA